MFFNKKKERQLKKEEQALKKMATRPADINVHMLVEEAQNVVCAYLRALFEVRPQLLPMQKMEEQIYNAALQSILHEQASNIQRRIVDISIGDVKAVDYDNHSMYMVSSITYEIEYTVQGEQYFSSGKCPFMFHRSGEFLFHYDGRMGWLLAQCIDNGEFR